MTFISLDFLIFFPLVTFVYFLTPHRFRWVVILLTSYYFYMCWKPIYALLIVFSTLAFLAKDKMFFKAGSISHITASVLLILIMINLMPGTFILTLQSVAATLASMLLLAGDVVVLLLWQQLQLKGKKKR